MRERVEKGSSLYSTHAQINSCSQLTEMLPLTLCMIMIIIIMIDELFIDKLIVKMTINQYTILIDFDQSEKK